MFSCSWCFGDRGGVRVGEGLVRIRSTLLKKKRERLLSISSLQIRSLVVREKKNLKPDHVGLPDPIAGQFKKKHGQRPRPSAESVWGRARYRFPQHAEARRMSVVWRLLGPFQFRPNFCTVKKSKKKGRACTRRTYKKKRQTTLSVSRRRRAAMRFWRRISLTRHVFLSISLPRQRVTTVST
jgi:hypothetical protein